MIPQLSIIIPTHNRATDLPQTLQALACQTVEPHRYEVIVVADNCRDNTARVVSDLQSSLPYTLKFLEIEAGVAAATRNRGVTLAEAPILLFLDDDMQAAPQLVAEHLAAHHEHPGGLVLGNFPLAPATKEVTDLLAVSSHLWWLENLESKALSYHRFTFQDVMTGNLSISRALFDEIGGFDERFKTAEDYEFGLRALKHGVRFRFVPTALAWHHDRPSLRRSFERANNDGRSHILLVQKHPEVLWQMRVGHEPYGRYRKVLRRLIWEKPLLARMLAQLMLTLLALANTLKVRRWWHRFYSLANDYYYWTGVKESLWYYSEWQRLRQEAGEYKPGFYELTIDLETDLPRLERLLQERSADGLIVRYASKRIGYFPPTAGAEALRFEHIRHFLLYGLDLSWIGVINLSKLAQNEVGNNIEVVL